MGPTSEGAGDRLEELFTEALERSGEERSSFLDRACGGDGALRRELEELLSAHEEAGSYLDELSDAIGSAAGSELETASRPRLRIGPYRALSVLGHGGMGAVYLAVRDDGAFEQKVALKLLHLDMETPEIRARFLAERQLLAGLSHPHIARLLDGGVTDEGRSYFAMEYVEGVPLTAYCRDRAPGIEGKLRLVLEVVDAVSYLHRNLIVHRDLKPSNVLVDADGRTKLLDFGIAKLLAGDPGEGRTRTGERVLTPQYAAPEQLRGEPVTTATDVYALGVVLYELLTGARPHERAVLDLGALARESTPPPSSRRKGIPRDLDLLCLKALRPEPARRYASAEQLGQDIERYLEGRPIAARPSTWRYRLGRFVRRNRGGVAAGLALAVLLAAGFVGERRLRSQAELARGRAEEEAAKAVAVSDFLGDLLSSVDPARAQGRDVAVADVLAEAAERLDTDASTFAELPAVETTALRLTIGRTGARTGGGGEPPAGRSSSPEDSKPARPRPSGGRRPGGRPLPGRRLRGRGADHRRVLDVRTTVLGEEHPDTLRSLEELADLYWYEQRFRRVRATRPYTLGCVVDPRRGSGLFTNQRAATGLYGLGRYDEAARLFAEALAGQERALGPDHPQTRVW
ncbi:MAG: protein kinase [Thermoanaerobaculia bacterium]